MDLELIQKNLSEKLEETKKSLETKAAEAADKAVAKVLENELKSINEKLAEIKGFDGEVSREALVKAMADVAILTKDFNDFQLQAKQSKTVEKNKSFNDVLASAIEEKTDDFAKMARGERGMKSIGIELDLKAVGDMSVSNNITGGSVWGANYAPGIIEAPKRKVHMRQIMTGGAVGTGTDFYFMKQNGAGEGGAAFVAEGAAKSQSDEDLIESSVKIETLAAYSRVTKKAMNNIPGFISFLQSRLVEKIAKAEDAAILYGDGNSPNPKGILIAGNFTVSATTSTTLVEKLIDDISYLEDTAERNADTIVLRPADYYSFFKNKASGSGEFDLPFNVAIVNGQLFINGVKVVASTALTAGDYIVGDFANGAQFLTQESLRLEFFEQDSDNVTKNKVTVRIEESVALPVYGSDYFIKGTV
jgi:HK97 family phage major capsid protein